MQDFYIFLKLFINMFNFYPSDMLQLFCPLTDCNYFYIILLLHFRYCFIYISNGSKKKILTVLNNNKCIHSISFSLLLTSYTLQVLLHLYLYLFNKCFQAVNIFIHLSRLKCNFFHTNLQKFKQFSKHFLQIQRPSYKFYFLIFSHVFQISTLLLLHARLLAFRYDVVILTYPSL